MSATIKDVAACAGVSVATVSKYINGGNLRERYRTDVERAIRELDYSVNEVARNLKMNRSLMIGILAPDITSSFVTDIIQHIQTALTEKGYIPLILDYQKSRETEWKQLNVLLRWKVSGIILFPGFNETDLCDRVAEMHIPLITVDQKIYGSDAECVVSNNYETAYRITERLYESGHRKIALCRGTKGTYSADERARGYEDAMKKLSLTPQIEIGNYTVEGGYTATKRFLSCSQRPTAILSCNYHMTIGLLRALTELNVHIPSDISVAAFDRQEFDFALPIRISCAEQPKEEIGRFAAERMVQKIEDPDSEPLSGIHTFPARLELTDSIRKL